MPLATIDKTTIRWKTSNLISLDGILMGSKILTGIQFVKKEESVRLQMYGQQLTDFDTGTIDSSVSTETAMGWTAVKSMDGKIISLISKEL